jgi:hypothetical protein
MGNPTIPPEKDPTIKLPSGASDENLGPVDIVVKEATIIDPSGVKWEWATELGLDSIEYAAAVAPPEEEERLLDLLYSSLLLKFSREDRMALLGKLHVTEGDEHRQLVKQLVSLEKNLPEPEGGFYGGLVPGKREDNGKEVIGMILFYKEEESGNNVHSGSGEENSTREAFVS